MDSALLDFLGNFRGQTSYPWYDNFGNFRQLSPQQIAALPAEQQSLYNQTATEISSMPNRAMGAGTYPSPQSAGSSSQYQPDGSVTNTNGGYGQIYAAAMANSQSPVAGTQQPQLGGLSDQQMQEIMSLIPVGANPYGTVGNLVQSGADTAEQFGSRGHGSVGTESTPGVGVSGRASNFIPGTTLRQIGEGVNQYTGLYYPSAVYYDPKYGLVTDTSNIKPTVKQDAIGNWLTAAPAIMGLMSGVIGPTMAAGSGAAAAPAAAGSGAAYVSPALTIGSAIARQTGHEDLANALGYASMANGAYNSIPTDSLADLSTSDLSSLRNGGMGVEGPYSATSYPVDTSSSVSPFGSLFSSNGSSVSNPLGNFNQITAGAEGPAVGFPDVAGLPNVAEVPLSQVNPFANDNLANTLSDSSFGNLGGTTGYPVDMSTVQGTNLPGSSGAWNSVSPDAGAISTANGNGAWYDSALETATGSPSGTPTEAMLQQVSNGSGMPSAENLRQLNGQLDTTQYDSGVDPLSRVTINPDTGEIENMYADTQGPNANPRTVGSSGATPSTPSSSNPATWTPADNILTRNITTPISNTLSNLGVSNQSLVSNPFDGTGALANAGNTMVNNLTNPNYLATNFLQNMGTGAFINVLTGQPIDVGSLATNSALGTLGGGVGSGVGAGVSTALSGAMDPGASLPGILGSAAGSAAGSALIGGNPGTAALIGAGMGLISQQPGIQYGDIQPGGASLNELMDSVSGGYQGATGDPYEGGTDPYEGGTTSSPVDQTDSFFGPSDSSLGLNDYFSTGGPQSANQTGNAYYDPNTGQLAIGSGSTSGVPDYPTGTATSQDGNLFIDPYLPGNGTSADPYQLGTTVVNGSPITETTTTQPDGSTNTVINGTNGADGTNGQSIVGPQGPAGINGTSTVGYNGTDGTNGVSVTGATGAPGTVGNNGLDGLNGLAGINGQTVIGGTGANGLDGVNGTSGNNGAPGIPGTNAVNGVNGTNGTDGTGTGTVINVGTGGDGSTGGLDLGSLIGGVGSVAQSLWAQGKYQELQDYIKGLDAWGKNGGRVQAANTLYSWQNTPGAYQAQSPGYQFALDQSNAALAAKASAGGFNYSGNVWDQLAKNTAGYASQNYNTDLTNQMKLAGLDNTQAAYAQPMGTALAGQISQNTNALSNAGIGAGGTTGINSAFGSALGSLFSGGSTNFTSNLANLFGTPT